MASIKEIKSYLDDQYGFDILIKRRKQEVVHARKVFTVICLGQGYVHKQIKEETGIKHTMCIHYKKTFNQIRDVDLDIYHMCIDNFSLDLQRYDSLNGIGDLPEAEKIIKRLKGMSRKDVKYFKEKVFDPFIRKLDFEKNVLKNI